MSTVPGSEKSGVAALRILGLDVGTNSIGWALVDEGKEIIAAGSRVFEAGTLGGAAAISSGRDEPKGAQRRQARLARRMIARRAQRLRNVYALLQGASLLPACDPDRPESRGQALDGLDERLRRTYPVEKPWQEHLLPYSLRARALDAALEPHALGRALFHLAQRRGFLSNRREARDPKEDPGKVKSAIESLAETMKAKGSRTLGEYFASLDPEAERIRGPGRWTDRSMYIDEFEAIWQSQQRFHPQTLTPELKRKVRKAIFFQRPLKSQKHLVGPCMLEVSSRRAPWPLLEVQRFRMLQKVNDLRVISGPDERGLSPEERAKLLDALEREGDRTFTQARKLLGLPKTARFNLQDAEEDRLVGNRTGAKLAKVFGARWQELAKTDRDAVVADLMSVQSDDALTRRAVSNWGLSEGQARELARVGLEDGHCALSAKAVRNLLPRLEQGHAYSAVRKELYPGRGVAEPPRAELAPAPRLRNPVVERSLTQLRKVVNALLRVYGKPDLVRVELARDLKRPRALRRELTLRNKQNQKVREDAAAAILRETGIRQPKASDIDKYLLWQECNEICPYTGSAISRDALFGPSPQFDVEHIIPYSRCLDDSFANKTLCHVAENRNRKRQRTPFEAYGSDQASMDKILLRVSKFQGRFGKEKLRRFKLTPEEVQESFAGFTQRHLQDTRYASLEAGRFLGSLFGCRPDQPGVDASGARRVQVSSGAVTGILRNEWGLNSVLNDGGVKDRSDHRHHAVDALVTALAGPELIQALSAAAEAAPRAGRRRFAPLTKPWPSLVDDARKAVAGIVVSHAQSRKVSGPLHEETLYSPPKVDSEGKKYVHVRKELEKLTRGELESVVDPVVRDVLEAHLQRCGGDLKKAFADPSAHPKMPSSGRPVPIHRVRIRKVCDPLEIGSGPRRRFVLPGANHHIEVIERTTDEGVKWESRMVSLFDASRRLAQGKPVVERIHPGAKFVCSLANGDSFEIIESGRRAIFVVRSLWTNGQIVFVPVADARPEPELIKAKAVLRRNIEPLRKAGFRKVSVDPIGWLWPSHE